jgi:putative SOS response-associated peptidase YedK
MNDEMKAALENNSTRLHMLMAGIWFENEGKPQVVTLTTNPNEKCSEIHKRMPVLIRPANAESWLSSDIETIQPLLLAVENELIHIEKVNNNI